MTLAFRPLQPFRVFDGVIVESLQQQIAALFAQGEQGAWYDIDPAYCFQDAAGTVPAVVGFPVGLVLDRSRGLVLGPDLVVNGDFSEGGMGWIVTGTATITGGKATIFSTGPSAVIYQQSILVPHKRYLVDFSVVVRSGEGKLEGPGGSIAFSFSASGNYSVLLTGVNNLAFNRVTACDFDIDNISVRELPGNHASQTTATSRPILRQNATTGAHYLEFDGSDDWLVTSSINFTATDKMTVWAGLRKLSDVGAQTVAELSVDVAANAGTFVLRAPRTSTPSFGWFSKGTMLADNSGLSPYPAPFSAVFAGIASIPEDVLDGRINGGAWVINRSDQGTGNYGNYPLYIGRRGGTSFPFNGHLYGLTIRGAQSNDPQIKIVERYLAQKTGVTLA